MSYQKPDTYFTTVDTRLSQYSHYSKGEEPVPMAVYQMAVLDHGTSYATNGLVATGLGTN